MAKHLFSGVLCMVLLLFAGCGPERQNQQAGTAPESAPMAPSDTLFGFGDTVLGFEAVWTEAGAPAIHVHGAQGIVQELEVPLPFDVEAPVSPEEREYLPDFGYEFEDYDFDGFADLARVRDLGAYNAQYNIWLYRPSEKRFEYSEALSRLVMPAADAESRTVTSYEKSGAVWYRLTTFEWVQGDIEAVRVETRELEQSAEDTWPVTIADPRTDAVICRLEDRLMDDGSIVSTLLEGDPAECPGT